MKLRHQTYAFTLTASLFLALGCGKESSPPNTTVQSAPTASLQISDGPIYNFGDQLVDSITTKTFTVTNTGKIEATGMGWRFFMSAYSYFDGDYPGTGGTCESSLPPGESCTIAVQFKPGYASTFEEVISINYFNGVVSTTTAAIIGSGRVSVRGKAISGP